MEITWDSLKYSEYRALARYVVLVIMQIAPNRIGINSFDAIALPFSAILRICISRRAILTIWIHKHMKGNGGKKMGPILYELKSLDHVCRSHEKLVLHVELVRHNNSHVRGKTPEESSSTWERTFSRTQ
jgi:Mg2+/Co2+ transporter CorB